MPRARAFSIMAGDRSTPSSRAASGLNTAPAKPVPQPRSSIDRAFPSRHHHGGEIEQDLRRGIGQLPDHAVRHNRRRIGRTDDAHSRDRSAARDLDRLAGRDHRRRGGLSRSRRFSSALSASPGLQPGGGDQLARADQVGIQPQRPLQFGDGGGQKPPPPAAPRPAPAPPTATSGLSDTASRASPGRTLLSPARQQRLDQGQPRQQAAAPGRQPCLQGARGFLCPARCDQRLGAFDGIVVSQANPSSSK